jgi:hypothetical protein
MKLEEEHETNDNNHDLVADQKSRQTFTVARQEGMDLLEASSRVHIESDATRTNEDEDEHHSI